MDTCVLLLLCITVAYDMIQKLSLPRHNLGFNVIVTLNDMGPTHNDCTITGSLTGKCKQIQPLAFYDIISDRKYN